MKKRLQKEGVLWSICGWMLLCQCLNWAPSLRNPLSQAGGRAGGRGSRHSACQECKETHTAAAAAQSLCPLLPFLFFSPVPPSLCSVPPPAPTDFNSPSTSSPPPSLWRGPSLCTTAPFSSSQPQWKPDAPLGCQDNSSIWGLADFLKKREWSLEILCKRKGRRRESDSSFKRTGERVRERRGKGWGNKKTKMEGEKERRKQPLTNKGSET